MNHPVPMELDAAVVAIATLYGNFIPGHGWTGFGPSPEKIAAALSALISSSAVAELEVAERNRDAARANFLTMQGAADTLRKRAETAERALQLMLEAYEGVYNCVGGDGRRYQDSDAKDAEIAARQALSPSIKEKQNG